jgi:ribulose kinase
LTVEAGDTRTRAYGVAFDIGTTSVAGYLVDLFTGREIARSARLNGQQPWGADVISRATHALESPQGVEELQAAVIETLNQILATTGRSPRGYYATAVGNSLAPPGVDPHDDRGQPLCRGQSRPLNNTSWIALPNAWICFFSIGAYVGDTLAAVMATVAF